MSIMSMFDRDHGRPTTKGTTRGIKRFPEGKEDRKETHRIDTYVHTLAARKDRYEIAAHRLNPHWHLGSYKRTKRR